MAVNNSQYCKFIAFLCTTVFFVYLLRTVLFSFDVFIVVTFNIKAASLMELVLSGSQPVALFNNRSDFLLGCGSIGK